MGAAPCRVDLHYLPRLKVRCTGEREDLATQLPVLQWLVSVEKRCDEHRVQPQHEKLEERKEKPSPDPPGGWCMVHEPEECADSYCSHNHRNRQSLNEVKHP